MYGSGIYDEGALRVAIAQARRAADVVLVDHVGLGLDPTTRALLDCLVVVVADDGVRLDAKWQRDQVAGRRRLDVPTDFAHKQFHESGDIGRALLSEADAVWGRDAGVLQAV